MTQSLIDYRKVETLRKQYPGARTSALIEIANVAPQNYYRGRRALLDGRTPSKQQQEISK